LACSPLSTDAANLSLQNKRDLPADVKSVCIACLPYQGEELEYRLESQGYEAKD
jgi:hypothetical protein